MITAAWVFGSVLAVGATWIFALKFQETLERRQQRRFLTKLLGPNLRDQMARPRVQVATVAVAVNRRQRRARSAAASPLSLLPHHAAATML